MYIQFGFCGLNRRVVLLRVRQHHASLILAATNTINIKITITHIIKPNKQAKSPHIHNVGYVFLISRVMKEIITPINESIGPAIITSVYVYGA